MGTRDLADKSIGAGEERGKPAGPRKKKTRVAHSTALKNLKLDVLRSLEEHAVEA